MRDTAILVILFPALLGGCAIQKTDTSPTLARFDGTTITENQFKKKFDSMPKNLQEAIRGKKKEFVEEMTSEHFLMKEAIRQKIDRDPEVMDLIQSAQRKITVAKLIESEVDRKVQVLPSEVEDYYQSHKEEFMTPLRLRASHILVKTEAEAASIRSALEQGADFEELARAKSEDPTAIRGGDLGFFQRGRFVKEFENAVYQLKKGEISQPVATQFGFHIIKLTDRLEPGLLEFNTVKRQIEERLTREKRSKVYKALVSRLKANARIEFEEEAIEKL